MVPNKIELVLEFYKKVKAANKELTKKEAFKDLLNRLYSNDPEIIRVIDKITAGSEKSILNIPRQDKLHKGSADTLYNKIIIEFENDLKKSLTHAKEQLAGYLLGQFNIGEGYNFTLIATDCIYWKVYAPDISQIEKIENKKILEDELILNEINSASFILNDLNGEEFYYWLDRFLFKEEKQKATLKRIEESFGYQSNVFIESLREFKKWFHESKHKSDIQVSYEQWNKFLSIAYGTFDASETNFLVHTYLSVFSKMLAYSVISNDDFIDDDEMLGILDGTIFQSYNISNLVDNDFFHWVKNPDSFRNLKKVFRLIAQEISTYHFNSVDEDILKGIYQELIDLDTRRTLGEYYTPDWLCERIVNEFTFKETDKILDPACGSGSFLRAIVHRIRFTNPNVEISTLNDQIYGIDIHPLSVLISKTTLLLALGKNIINSPKPIHLNIILANTLLAPEGVNTIWGSEFTMLIDREKYILNTQIFTDVKLFDDALDICEELSSKTIWKSKSPIGTFDNVLSKYHKKGGINPQVLESFYKIYEGLKSVKENKRDSIWKFIIQNLYKPYFLSNKFNYIIGNPPWFTYSSIKNEGYQYILDQLAVKFDVKPAKVANYPNLEIAAIFQAYCCSYFLKEEGELAFVLPRAFFSADHHDNSRSGKAKGFKIKTIWDLRDVTPLFRIPSCVIFSKKAFSGRTFPKSGLNGLSFSGTLPEHNCSYQKSLYKLSEEPVKWYYVKQGKSTAFSNQNRIKENQTNPYKIDFKQGATIIPRAFYFIELSQDSPCDFKDRILNIRTSRLINDDAKKPWKDIVIKGRIESEFIFRTAIGKNILPFNLYCPDLVVLPIIIKTESNGLKSIQMHSSGSLLSHGYLNASNWFSMVEENWCTGRTEKNQNMSSENYLNWLNKLTDQNLDKPYLVVYNGRGTDACACVINRSDYDLEFFVDHANYWIGFSKLEEAHYVSAILNSSTPNLLMKDFQSTGLYGARNIHKKILDIYFPKFQTTENVHKQLASLSINSHNKANQFLIENPPGFNLSALHLGKIRVLLRKHLLNELKSIDALVKRII